MSAVLATASPRRIKASHRRRRKVTLGPIVQRYYDPAIGRFLSVDPSASDINTAWNFNRYSYAANNPYKFVDPDGRDINCAGATCVLVPVGGGLPTITFPRPSGFPSKISKSQSLFFHHYRFKDSAPKGDASYRNRLNFRVMNSPTPNKNEQATYAGRQIDVNVNNDISALTGRDTVTSYRMNLSNGNTAVLNVTTGDHAATWGIVLRLVDSAEDGTQSIITYGEGDSLLQRAFDPRNKQSRKTWKDSAIDAIDGPAYVKF